MERILNSKNTVTEAEIQKSNEALQKVLSRKDLGFFQVPERAQLWSEVDKRAAELRSHADDLVIVGIGGSSLGPKALYEIFKEPKSQKRLHFCDNVDALAFEKMWNGIANFERTTWVFISKSGSTIETLVAADMILQRYEKQKWNFQATVVSEMKSNPLTDWAKENKVPCLEIPLDVGGRFSVLTAVGMLPMAFLGVSTSEFREGAHEAVQNLKLQSELMAHFYQSFQRNEWITFFWFYTSSYENFGRWVQQLWAESLGKAQDRKGQKAPRASTPMYGIGSSDQHSVLQQLMEGAKDKLIVFYRFANIEKAGEAIALSHFPSQSFFNGHKMGQLIAAQAQGTQQALNEQNVSTMCIQVDDMNAKSVGFQMMSWQLVVAGLGELMDINAFDQPGVELGKRLAKTILKS
jgi:glucose-6-phosphate isomerase